MGEQKNLRAPNLVVGATTGDDAAAWKNPDGTLTLSTLDAFTPIVNDAYTFGQIAAANAASDIYAMGADPSFALNIAVWPQKELPLEVLSQVLNGGAEMALKGGWTIAGGHTLEGTEPIYGQAVMGTMDSKNLLTNAKAKADEVLVLTKPLGTGLMATALKSMSKDLSTKHSPAEPPCKPNHPLYACYQEAVLEMTRLNKAAKDTALASSASAATDVTGFGLLGHLHKMALASGLAARLDTACIPVLAGAIELLEYSPGGTQRNLDFVKDHIDTSAKDLNLNLLPLWADPQTSGGLLFSCAGSGADRAIKELTDSGHRAAVVGSFTDKHPPGKLILV